MGKTTVQDMGVRGRLPEEKPAPDNITIGCDIVNETSAAIFVDSDGDRVWLPKSQVQIFRLDTDKATQNRANISIPRWLYRQKFPDDPV